MMNLKKRKAENDDLDCVNAESSAENQTQHVIDKNEHAECVSSTEVQQKTENNGASSSSQAGTSDIKLKTENDNSPDVCDYKHIKLEEPKVAGTLLFCGGTNWDLIGRKDLPKNAKGGVGENLYAPHRLSALQGIRVTGVFAGCTACHSVIIAEGGIPYTWGRGDKGQLGHGDTKRRETPTMVKSLKGEHIVAAACGRSHTLFLSESGVVYSSGDNKRGQLGVGSKTTEFMVPTKVKFKESKIITKVACGAEFSVIIDIDGGLWSFGSPEYGQLGNNTDGQYFVGTKLTTNCELVPQKIKLFVDKPKEGHVVQISGVHISQVACGVNHCVAVDNKNRCYTWGFAGYGRLGHAGTKDELVPRLVRSRTFGPNTVKSVYAGGTFSIATNVYGVVAFWGMNKKGAGAEATMYPKPIQDLMGWSVKDISCGNSSIVVIADESVIAWGPATNGELGYGEFYPSRLGFQRGSSVPKEVKTLEGIRIESVACGYAHTLFIAADATEEDKGKLDEFPEHTP